MHIRGNSAIAQKHLRQISEDSEMGQIVIAEIVSLWWFLLDFWWLFIPFIILLIFGLWEVLTKRAKDNEERIKRLEEEIEELKKEKDAQGLE